MPPQANGLVLDLLSAVGERPVPVRALVRAAELFGITENSLRVALARLVSDGKVERNERGSYGLGAAAQPVQRRVTAWAKMEERVVAWRGPWIALHTAGLPRGSRAEMKRRLRALEFLGMRELAAGLHVRPDNLDGGAPAVRAELRELGWPPGVLVCGLRDLDSATEARARRLWEADALDEAYRTTTTRLTKSGAALFELPLEQAVVESFLLGGRAIRQLAFDPLLPEPIVDPTLRRALVEAMRHYDVAGRRIWKKFMQSQGAPALESVLGFRSVGGVA
jgi:phenylacetic acid degradation operon negative regulatory protein